MAPGSVVLSARDLDVARDGRMLLRGIDLELRRGELVALLGPNGVGKSTLLAVLAGLLEPAAGALQIYGRVAAGLQSPALARRTVRANVEAALGWWGMPRTDRADRARRALAEMRAQHLASRDATTLSGGEARRVHLARSIALEPDVLLLDEPFAGLDPGSRAELLADAGSVLRDPRRATLVVVHDRAEAWALADRLVILLDGSVVADGAPAAVLDEPPTPEVARFLGFTGRVAEPGGAIRCTRPRHVCMTDDGPIRGVVTRRIPEEDGVLVEAAVPGGALSWREPLPGPAERQTVRLRVEGGVRFERGGAS